jgi:hypothetical protein
MHDQARLILSLQNHERVEPLLSETSVPNVRGLEDDIIQPTFVLQTRKGADVDQAIRKFAKLMV